MEIARYFSKFDTGMQMKIVKITVSTSFTGWVLYTVHANAFERRIFYNPLSLTEMIKYAPNSLAYTSILSSYESLNQMKNVTVPLPFNDWAACHYHDVIMSAIASQITSLTIVYSTFYSRRRSKKTSKLRVTGLCAGNSLVAGKFPHKGPVTRKMLPFDDEIMCVNNSPFAEPTRQYQ